MVPDHGDSDRRVRKRSRDSAHVRLEVLAKERDEAVTRAQRYKRLLQEAIVAEFERGKPYFTSKTPPEVFAGLDFEVDASVKVGAAWYALKL